MIISTENTISSQVKNDGYDVWLFMAIMLKYFEKFIRDIIKRDCVVIPTNNTIIC